MGQGMLRAMALLGLLAALAGCQEPTSKVMQTWIGQSDTALLAQWGAPELESGNGRGVRVLSYYGRNIDGVTICRQNFTVRDGQVIAVSHNCPL